MRPILRNNKGLSLVVSYLTVFALLTLSVGISAALVNEHSSARRHKERVAAFWLAEAGIHRFIQDPTILDTTNPLTISYGNNSSLQISRDDSAASVRVVTATGTSNGFSREIQVEFPANAFTIFSNTMATGGNIHLAGFGAYLEVFGDTSLSGVYTSSGWGASAWFENKQENVASDETTLLYPDADNNGTPDEFSDFVQYNRDFIAEYPSSDVVYLQPLAGETVTIVPNQNLVDKKVLYVEGPASGEGDVNILFDATWSANQNLTVISTGTVNYIQPLQSPAANSKLNIISWESYNEPSVLVSTHSGTTYTHGDADYYSVLQFSDTRGTIIANQGVQASEILAWKRFQHDSSILMLGVPGLEDLIGRRAAGYRATPSSWKEI